jgi:hypothetical protein
MVKQFVLGGALILSACGTTAATGPGAAPTAQRQPSIYDGAPDWVQKGSGAFGGERGKSFYGVGAASNIRNESLRRTAADAMARTEIAKIMNTYAASLTKIYQESTSGGDPNTQSQESQMVTNAVKNFTQSQLNGVEVVQHWISNDGTSEFALAQLDFSSFKDNMNQVKQLNDRAREVIKARADQAFGELGAEEAKRAAPAGGNTVNGN